MDTADAIVVGGGLAGLGTGALLAHAGLRVIVCERRPVLGGRALVVQQDGFTWNYGLHYIVNGYRSPHYRILKRIGKTDVAPVIPVDVKKLWRMRGGRIHQVPATPLALLQTELLSSRGKFGLLRALFAMYTANVDRLWHVPLGKWLNRVAPETSLRDFLLDLGGPLAFEPNPREFSAAHFILLARPLLSNPTVAIYPVGGWITLFEAFKSRIEEAGGEVRVRAAVDKLEIEEGAVTGVWSKGERLRAKAVVLTMPPNELTGVLKETPLDGLSLERVQQIRPTMGMAIDLGTIGVKNDRIAAIEFPEDAMTSGMHSVWDPTLAPQDGHVFQCVRFLNPEQMEDKAELDRTESIFLDRLETVWPDIRDKVVTRRKLIRPILTSASHRYDQPRPTLLPFQIPHVHNLYLAGDATQAPGELSGSAGESAILCAERIMQRTKG